MVISRAANADVWVICNTRPTISPAAVGCGIAGAYTREPGGGATGNVVTGVGIGDPVFWGGLGGRVAIGTICSARLDGAEVSPAASMAVAVMLWAPVARTVTGVKLQTPVAFASTVPAILPSIFTLTVLPSPATPLKVGSVISVMPSPATPLSLPVARPM